MLNSRFSSKGFTIVELLIVIVVIGVLAAITLVAYNGIQARAHDSQRESDIRAITTALEMYYLDHGEFPPGQGSTLINPHWSTTADASWVNLEAALSPYVDKLPTDPVGPIDGGDPRESTNGRERAYSYYSNTHANSHCDVGVRQMYVIVYRFDSKANSNTIVGECPTTSLTYPGSSSYKVAK